MTADRKIPHVLGENPKFALQMLMELSEENYTKTADRINGGTLDHNLHILLTSAATYAVRNAILDYYQSNADTDSVLNLFAEAAQCIRYLFDLVAYEGKPTHFEFEYQNSKREISRLPQMSEQHIGRIQDGLEFALLSGSHEHLDFLSSRGAELFDTPGVEVSDFDKVLTLYMQLLFAGLDKDADRQRKYLRNNLSKGHRLGAKLAYARCSLFLAIPDRDEDRLNMLVQEMLNAHSKWAVSGNNIVKPECFISRTTMAALALIHRRGITLTIKHPYFPSDLMEAVFQR